MNLAERIWQKDKTIPVISMLAAGRYLTAKVCVLFMNPHLVQNMHITVNETVPSTNLIRKSNLLESSALPCF